MPRNQEHDDFRPTACWETLRFRAALLRRTRDFFDAHGFLEVDTPILSADTVVDRQLDPFCVVLPGGAAPGGDRRRMWLQTSPEFAMKRLLASGAGAIYQIAHVFRQDEIGRLHNSEFTMIEWYRPADGLQEGMQFLSDVAETLLARGAAEPIRYAEAFERALGVNPHEATSDALAATAKSAGIVVPESMEIDDRDGWLDLLLTERVQPRLGAERPAILYDFPASQAALARVREEIPPVAERFELYADGVELANGYHELLDPAVLRHRNATTNRRRQADGKAALPEESRLLAAMDSGLPACTGVALGFDRAVMLALGAADIREVIAFPFDRA
jgi:lysyl-tRNA synthetase class 2